MIGPALFCALALIVGAVALWTSRPWLSAVAFCLTVVFSVVLWQSSLGRPRPVIMEMPSGNVVGFVLDEPRAIYLWVAAAQAAPVAYALPWDERQAAALQQAAQSARKAHQELAVGPRGTAQPRDGAFALPKGALRFYPVAHARLPPKAME